MFQEKPGGRRAVFEEDDSAVGCACGRAEGGRRCKAVSQRSNSPSQRKKKKDRTVIPGGKSGPISATTAFKIFFVEEKKSLRLPPWNPRESLFSLK